MPTCLLGNVWEQKPLLLGAWKGMPAKLVWGLPDQVADTQGRVHKHAINHGTTGHGISDAIMGRMQQKLH